jgi:type IV pilus assembly protein PilM
MESALRLEARKYVPFDVAGAALDYQVLDGVPEGSQSIEVLVALAGAGTLAQHLKVLERAGLNPSVVDVLPVAAGNALWNWVDPSRHDAHHVALHIGPQISTIVIDGARSPYFNRYVYFAAEDYAGREQGSVESEKRIQGLVDEVSRSLAFYETSAGARGFQEISLLGEFLDIPSLEERLRRQTGLAVRKMDMPRRLGYQHDFPVGRFDLAVALALLAGGEE